MLAQQLTRVPCIKPAGTGGDRFPVFTEKALIPRGRGEWAHGPGGHSMTSWQSLFDEDMAERISIQVDLAAHAFTSRTLEAMIRY